MNNLCLVKTFFFFNERNLSKSSFLLQKICFLVLGKLFFFDFKEFNCLGIFIAEANIINGDMRRQKPRHLRTAEANFER